MFCLRICLRIKCVPGAREGQKGVLDPLEVELQVVVSLHVGSEMLSHLFSYLRESLGRGL